MLTSEKALEEEKYEENGRERERRRKKKGKKPIVPCRIFCSYALFSSLRVWTHTIGSTAIVDNNNSVCASFLFRFFLQKKSPLLFVEVYWRRTHFFFNHELTQSNSDELRALSQPRTRRNVCPVRARFDRDAYTIVKHVLIMVFPSL